MPARIPAEDEIAIVTADGACDTRSAVEQIEEMPTMIRQSPDSRRLIVSARNPGGVPEMALPPCHTLWQVRILGGKLHLQLYQRSANVLLGPPSISGTVMWFIKPNYLNQSDIKETSIS